MISAMPTLKYFNPAYVFVDRIAPSSCDKSLTIRKHVQSLHLFIEAATERVLTST